MSNSILLKNYPKDVRDMITRARRYSIAGVCLVAVIAVLSASSIGGGIPIWSAMAGLLPFAIVFSMAFHSGTFSYSAASFPHPLTTASDALRFMRAHLVCDAGKLLLLAALFYGALQLGLDFVQFVIVFLVGSMLVVVITPSKYRFWQNERLVPKIYGLKE